MIKGLAVRPALPDLAAALRSLVAVAAITAIAMQWGPPGSATTAGGAAAIAGACAFQDSPRSRVPLVYLASALAGGAVLLGALTASVPVLFVVVAAAWCAGAAMLWANGPNTGLLGAASGALLVGAQVASPALTAAPWTAALAVAGALTQAAVIAIWPPQRWRDQRDAVVTAYRSLATDTRRLVEDRDGWRVDTEPLVALREAFTRTTRPTSRRPADYRGWYALPERIAATLTDIASGSRSDALDRALEEAADTMMAVADTSRSGRVRTDVAITRFDSVVDDVEGPEFGPVQRLSALLHEVVAMRLGDFVPSTPDAVRLRRSELPSSVRAAIETVRGHLRQRSPVLRHSARLAAAIVAGCAIEHLAHVPYGYWIPLTVLLVLRPETAHTYTRCVGRLAGSLVGIVAASTVLILLDPPTWVSAAFAVVGIASAYLVSGLGFIAMSSAVAAAAVFLLEVSRDGAPPSMTDPVLATLIGGGLAVVSHVVLPDDQLTRLAQRAGELLKTEIDYAATVIKGYVHVIEHPADALSAAWQRAYRARAAFEATSGAMRMEAPELRHWLRSYRTAVNSLTASCATLEANLPQGQPTIEDRQFAVTVDEYVEALCGDPPTAASPWTVDSAELEAAAQRLREAAARYGADDGSSRVLVAEASAIARHLNAIEVIPAPSAAR
ncbi:hypothetical protein CYL16_02605 [Mycobacterium sp. EPG1]|nr:hypothetical protein CYL16_02605 [Mycobacterium sp. EPG1]